MEVKLVIFSYPRLTSEMQGIWNELKSNMNIEVLEGIFGETITLAKKLEKEGKVDVFISGGANASILRNSVNIPVVSFKVTTFDIVRAILQAQKNDGHMAVIGYEKNNPDLREIEEMLSITVYEGVYHDKNELIIKLKSLREKGIKNVIGSSLVCHLAEKFGMKGILVYSRESVRQAIEGAHEIALSRRRDVEKAEHLKAILDYTYSGIISIDRNGRITALNPVAGKIVGVPEEKAIGRIADEIIPNTRLLNVVRSGKTEINQLMKIGNTSVITSRIPIKANNRIVGVVATFQDITSIQNAEGKIRQNLHDKGLFAKFTFSDIVGQSPGLLRTLERAKKFAGTESTIMINGETGTGKELLAQSIHNCSNRMDKPFVAVNCVALPENLLESELFGYEEGAFTGARRGGKIGLFELAHGGTIFLDEIGEIPLSFQSRLLRVLQEREIMRVGGNKIIPIDVRVITATSLDMWKAVIKKKLRGDLYYRLNVLQVYLPALRERKEDIPLLVHSYIGRQEPALMRRIYYILPKLLPVLESYFWPGNIRELQNVLERFLVLAKDTDFTPDNLREILLEAMNNQYTVKNEYNKDGKTNILQYSSAENMSKNIYKVIHEVNGNKSEAARRLGVSRMTLWRRLKEGEKL